MCEGRRTVFDGAQARMQDLAIDTSKGWSEVPQRIRCGRTLGDPWESLFGPLRRDSIVVGQIGQSLDGRVAKTPGEPTIINGPEGIAHLHRLRALVDAVVVGAGTIRADDPQLTVRHVAGPNPVRVVIDPRRSLPVGSRAFAGDGVHRIVITRRRERIVVDGGIETIALPDADGLIAPAAILSSLRERGLRRILIEGGAKTFSFVLSADCLDRLHVMVAPIVLGSGVSGLDLPPIARRVPMRTYTLGSDVLFDCDLRSGESAGR
jgi:riboflavin-specific deaminase-like protein